MFFRIGCKSNNPFISILKENRFHIDNHFSDCIYFRKTINIHDDIILNGFITPDGLITQNNNNKLFYNYYKQGARNKCPYEMVSFLSENVKKILLSISENNHYIEFSYSEDFTHLQEIKISREDLNNQDFYIEFETRYIINKT